MHESNPTRPAPVSLRRVQRGDIDMFRAHDHDDKAAKMAGVKPRTDEAFRELWEQVLAREDSLERTVLVAGVPAGRVACFEAEGLRLVGYWIGREFWNRGVATRALALMLEEVPHRPLYAKVQENNAGSVRVLERNGFALIASSDEPETERFLAGRVLTFRLG